MSPSKIKVGETYRNRGAGRTTRKVLAIGVEHRPPYWYNNDAPPDEPGVLFEQKGNNPTCIFRRLLRGPRVLSNAIIPGTTTQR